MEILGLLVKLLERGRFTYVSMYASMYRPVRLGAGLLAAKDPDRVHATALEFALSQVLTGRVCRFVSRIRFGSEQLDSGTERCKIELKSSRNAPRDRFSDRFRESESSLLKNRVIRASSSELSRSHSSSRRWKS
jgi:hypothetical protein